MSILIKNGRIVNYDKTYTADILIDDGIITRIEENITSLADKTIDAHGKYIIPGAIDPHTHLDMPYGSIKSRDDFETGTIAAAFGGTTTIIDFAIQDKDSTLINALQIWLSKAEGKSVIDYGLHMIITDVNQHILDEIKSIVEAGVTSFKLFTAYPDRLMLKDADIFRVMQKANEYSALIMMHAENGDVIDFLVKQALARGDNSPIFHAITRPSAFEAEAVYRSIMLAAVVDVPIYIVHVSSGEAVDVIKFSQQKYNKIFSETCPHYLLLTDDLLEKPDFEGAKYVLSPPLRKKSDQEKLWNAIEQNIINTIGTDHCPFNFADDKKLGLEDFTKIPNGGPGIENRIQLLYDRGVLRNRISLNRWVELISTNPAKIFGLYPKKGTISIGSDADIVVWNPNTEFTISARTHHMNVDYNLYEGYKVTGNADVVISNGEVIIQDNKFVGKKGRGKFLRRNTFKLIN